MQFTNRIDTQRGEVVVEGTVGAPNAISRKVPIHIHDPGAVEETTFHPIGAGSNPAGGGGVGRSGGGGNVGTSELPAPGQWSRTFALPGPVTLEQEGRAVPDCLPIVYQCARTPPCWTLSPWRPRAGTSHRSLHVRSWCNRTHSPRPPPRPSNRSPTVCSCVPACPYTLAPLSSQAFQSSP